MEVTTHTAGAQRSVSARNGAPPDCSSTHEEEARTAALTACRLIRKEGLRLTEAGTAPWGGSGFEREVARREALQRPEAPRPRVRDKPPNGGTWTKAQRAGR